MATTDHTSGVSLSNADWADDVDCAAYSVLTSVAGSTTLTATGPATYTYSSTRPAIFFTPVSTNTGPATLNVQPSGGSALGAKDIFHNGAALLGGELRQSVPVGVIYDGTRFHLLSNAANWTPVLSTAIHTTSGTARDVTGIPGYVTKFTVQLNGVSTNSTGNLLFQIGDSGGVETAGYISNSSDLGGGPSNSQNTSGVHVNAANSSNVISGSVVFSLLTASTNTWVANGQFVLHNSTNVMTCCGIKSLSAPLDRVRLTTTGSDTFDAGSMSVLYE